MNVKRLKIERPKDELKSLLREQVLFLLNSCESFDRGFIGEAKRMATIIRTLVHDTDGPSKSLLGQLKRKTRMHFLDTSHFDNPANLLPFTGLIGIQIKDGVSSYWASLDGGSSPRRLSEFKSWWHRNVIDDKKGNKFSKISKNSISKNFP